MERKRIIVCISISVIFFIVFSINAVLAKEYKYKLPRHPQDTRYWCGLAVAETWIQYLTGKDYSQIELAARYPKTLNGVSAGNLEAVLEGMTGKGFQDNEYKSESSAFKKIREELKKEDRPIAFAGNACNPNGKPRDPGKHWMMIEGLNMDREDKVFQGAYVYDPLYGSDFASDYEVLRPRTWVKDLFKKWWLTKNGVRYTVDD